MNKTIKKYYKIIVILFSGIGLYLMWKLFAVGGYFYCGGGGFIDICIIPTGIKYTWISASTIALVFFIISILLIIIIRNTKKKMQKIYISLIILFLGLIGKQIFFLISPDFKFYLNPPVYRNSNNELIDLDKYLELTTKYCDILKPGDDFDFVHSRETMCSGKFEVDFETADQYIKILEHAKNNNFRYLYQHTFRFIDENVGLENMIEQYNDDTFYAYVIGYTSNIDFLNIIKKKINNKDLEIILDYYIEKINYYNNNNFTQDDGYKYWDDLSKEIDNRIEKISTINKKVFN